MTAKQARNLLPFTVVVWDGDRNDVGTVIEINAGGFYVDWQNRSSGWLDFNDAEKVSIY